jgi:hypothetical protein
MVDTRIHDFALAEKWNDFFDFYRGRDYEYLFIVANDTIGRIESFDYMVQLAYEQNVDLLNCNVNRNLELFEQNLITYRTDLIEDGGTSNFLIKKGVIEKVGRVDEYFPHEYVERDYFHRVKLAGFNIKCTPMELFYHPPQSRSQVNRLGVGIASDRFNEKWGTGGHIPTLTNPKNDPNLNYEFCIGGKKL